MMCLLVSLYSGKIRHVECFVIGGRVVCTYADDGVGDGRGAGGLDSSLLSA